VIASSGVTAETGSNRVNRGGGWNDNAVNCRSANRDRNSPGNRDDNLGFRLVNASPPFVPVGRGLRTASVCIRPGPWPSSRAGADLSGQTKTATPRVVGRKARSPLRRNWWGKMPSLSHLPEFER